MNKQLWELYKESKRGKDCIALFSPKTKNFYESAIKIAEFMSQPQFNNNELNSNIISCWMSDFLYNIHERGIRPKTWTKESFAQLVGDLDIFLPIQNENGTITFDQSESGTFLKKNMFRNKASLTHCFSLAFPHGERHFENAPMVIEAKFDMSSMQELQNAFKQGLSYARLLHASYMGVCDKERFILYKINKNGFTDSNMPIFENHWITIYSDNGVGAELNHLIGREAIVKILSSY